MTTTVLVTPDAPRFAPGRYVALPPIPCRTCGGKMVVPIERNGPDDIVGEIHCDCTDGTEPLTECLIATPGTECETCDGLGVYMVDGPSGEPVPAGWCPDCTNGQRPGVVLGRATFGAGLPITRTLDPPGVDEWVYLDLHGAPTLVWRQRDGLDGSDIPASARLGVWADGNVAYPIESYTLVTDHNGCPECGGDLFFVDDCELCVEVPGRLTAPWSPPWLPTEPGVHRVEVEG